MFSAVTEAGLSAKTRRIPGEEGVWVFICGDMLLFALFFLTFVYYRSQAPGLYIDSQQALHKSFGLLNTLILLTSSWCVATAVRSARMGWRRSMTGLLGAAIACGLGFVAVKFVEYGEKFSQGITVHTNEFFMFYFMFTGIHLVHVLIGLGVLTFLLMRSRGRLLSEGDIQVLEGGTAFWHLVDLLWVVLFALLYLMR